MDALGSFFALIVVVAVLVLAADAISLIRADRSSERRVRAALDRVPRNGLTIEDHARSAGAP